MDWIAPITFDQIALSLVTLGLLRGALVACLPDHVAGPGGWLIDTGPD